MELRHCYQPWTEIQIQYDKTVGCCCYYRERKDSWDFDTEPRFDLERYWNGPHSRKMRKIIRSNDTAETGCSDCQFITFTDPGFPQSLSSLPTAKQQTNFREAVAAFNEKKPVIGSYPVRCYFNFGFACNLRCVMCSLADMKPRDRHTLPGTIFSDLSSYFEYAEPLVIGHPGGTTLPHTNAPGVNSLTTVHDG